MVGVGPITNLHKLSNRGLSIKGAATLNRYSHMLLSEELKDGCLTAVSTHCSRETPFGGDMGQRRKLIDIAAGTGNAAPAQCNSVSSAKHLNLFLMQASLPFKAQKNRRCTDGLETGVWVLACVSCTDAQIIIMKILFIVFQSQGCRPLMRCL